MSRPAISLQGVFPPIPTPFDGEGNVAYQAITQNLDRWNRYDLAGYVVLGSNWEAVYLSDEEKVRVLQTARQAIPGDRLLLAGTGCHSTRQTITLTRQAAQIGADAALVVTPHYYSGKMTPEALLRHYHAVADASPIPILIYNVPKFTAVNVDAASVSRIAEHPNVVGIKDTSGNITQLGETVQLAGPDFQVLAGSAGFFLAGLTLGAVGGILALANVAPQPSIDIYHHFEAGQWDQALALQRRMFPVNAAVTSNWGIAGLKAALDMVGYYGGPVRSPLLPLGEEQVQALRAILIEAGIL
jgi:4-hydroxy-2-oxoglutarate aldolase